MRRAFDVLRWRYLAMAVSGIFILVGIVLFFVLGFNTGIDFGSGYSERVQIAPLGFTVTYTGPESAVLSVDEYSGNVHDIVIIDCDSSVVLESGVGTDNDRLWKMCI